MWGQYWLRSRSVIGKVVECWRLIRMGVVVIRQQRPICFLDCRCEVDDVVITAKKLFVFCFATRGTAGLPDVSPKQCLKYEHSYLNVKGRMMVLPTLVSRVELLYF